MVTELRWQICELQVMTILTVKQVLLFDTETSLLFTVKSTFKLLDSLLLTLSQLAQGIYLLILLLLDHRPLSLYS